MSSSNLKLRLDKLLVRPQDNFFYQMVMAIISLNESLFGTSRCKAIVSKEIIDRDAMYRWQYTCRKPACIGLTVHESDRICMLSRV